MFGPNEFTLVPLELLTQLLIKTALQNFENMTFFHSFHGHNILIINSFLMSSNRNQYSAMTAPDEHFSYFYIRVPKETTTYHLSQCANIDAIV